MDNNIEVVVIEIKPVKVYVKIDSNKIVKEVGSSNFIQNLEGWIYIDEGYSDKYCQAQGNYLEKGLMDSKYRYNYKYDTKLIELTEEEKNILFPPIEPKPTEIDILTEKNSTLEKALLEMAEVQSKEYENRKILENAVLDLANTIAGGK